MEEIPENRVQKSVLNIQPEGANLFYQQTNGRKKKERSHDCGDLNVISNPLEYIYLTEILCKPICKKKKNEALGKFRILAVEICK